MKSILTCLLNYMIISKYDVVERGPGQKCIEKVYLYLWFRSLVAGLQWSDCLVHLDDIIILR